MAIHYIDPTGGDDETPNDTVPGTPRQTWPLTNPVGGDTYLQKRGTTTAQRIYQFTSSDVTVGSYYSAIDGSDDESIAQPEMTGDGTTANQINIATGVTGIVIRNFKFIGDDLNEDAFLSAKNDTTFLMENCEIDGNNCSKLFSMRGIGHIIRNCVLYNAATNIIQHATIVGAVWTDTLIENCNIVHNGTDDALVAKKFDEPTCVTDRITVRNCYIELTGVILSENCFDILVGDGHIIEDCTLIAPLHWAVRFVGTATNCIARRNHIKDSGWGGVQLSSTGHKVHSNIIENCGLIGTNAGVEIASADTSDIEIFNNTFIGGDDTIRALLNIHDEPPEHAFNVFSDIVIHNNIFYSTDLNTRLLVDFGTSTSSDEVTLDNNLYRLGGGANAFDLGGVTYATLDDWQAATVHDDNSIEAEPLLDTDYYPTIDSPCIGAGIWTGTFLKDFNNRTFKPTNPSIGAFEHASRDRARTRQLRDI